MPSFSANDEALFAAADRHYSQASRDQEWDVRMECRKVFLDLSEDAAMLRLRLEALAPDPVFVAVLDARREAWIAHVESLSDPEGLCWDAGIRP